jgi:hypothetical protein
MGFIENGHHQLLYFVLVNWLSITGIRLKWYNTKKSQNGGNDGLFKKVLDPFSFNHSVPDSLYPSIGGERLGKSESVRNQ